jgi:antitoxin HicB
MDYPVILTPDDNGTLLVTCPDLPEVTTFGEDQTDALQRAADAIEEALAARIAHRDEIPSPSPAQGRLAVSLAPLTVAKIALYQAARERGVSEGGAQAAPRLARPADRSLVRPAAPFADRPDRSGASGAWKDIGGRRQGRRLTGRAPSPF